MLHILHGPDSFSRGEALATTIPGARPLPERSARRWSRCWRTSPAPNDQAVAVEISQTLNAMNSTIETADRVT